VIVVRVGARYKPQIVLYWERLGLTAALPYGWGDFGSQEPVPRVKEIMSGVSIVCFAASYTVALVLEITRLLFRSGIRGAVMLGFAAAGLLAHSIYLYHRALRNPAAPLSSAYDWYLIAAWLLMAIYLYLIYYHPRAAFGLFLLPLVLGLIGAAHFADPSPFGRDPAARVWGLVHAGSVLLAVVAVLTGFATGLMYLYQARRLKRRIPPARGFFLPSLEWLQRTNSRAVVVAVLMLGIGLVTGSILNLVARAPGSGRMPWHDPVILSTAVTFVCLLISSLFAAFYQPARQGAKVACLTLVAFLFLVVALGVGLFMRTQHGPKPAMSQGVQAGRGENGDRIGHRPPPAFERSLRNVSRGGTA
jgi:ABC-type transport system involved in cytochrome c biogenesis permease subunit